MHFFEEMRHEVARSSGYIISGEVSAIKGLAIEISGISHHIAVGERCFLERDGKPIYLARLLVCNNKACLPCPLVRWRELALARALKSPIATLLFILMLSGWGAPLMHSDNRLMI